MNLHQLNDYFNTFLQSENFKNDVSLNGIQIENAAPDAKEIKKVAFAVDACEATAKKAAEYGADALFVHHGLFWGQCQTITGGLHKRVSAFIKNDLALIAYHSPLDANAEVGNNFGIARRMNLKDIRPFGNWRGMTIGAMGSLESPVPPDALAQLLFPHGEKPSHILPFGKKDIKTVAIISGGAGGDFGQAVAAGADAYITGEVGHEEFHAIEEAHITVIAGGHYQTETVGVGLVREKLERETGVETVFIDIPTGL